LSVDKFGIEGEPSQKRTAVLVPKGDTIRVLSDPAADDERMVEVEWHGKNLAMFAVDLQNHGDEVKCGTAG